MFYIGFPILSLIYISILLIVYFSKKRINLFENKVLSALMIINAIGLILELLCYAVLVFLEIQDTILGMTILKSYIFYMYIFDWVLTGYICMLTNKEYDKENYNKKEYYKNCLKLLSPIMVVGFFITYFTKLEYYNISPKYYTYGISTDFLVYLTSFLAPFWVYRCIKVSIEKKSREYNIRIGTILLGIILVGMAGALMQLVDRSILILTSAHTIMLVLIYFTIENPDLQMVEELNKNRELTEENFEEKSNFLFKISQDIKQPLQKIAETSNNIIETTKGQTQEQAKEINTNAKQLYTYVNNALDISTMDIKNLKIINGRYKTKNFFGEIKLRVKTELKNQNKDLEFRTNISKNIPEILSGDNTKIKQVILSIIFDSIKHTEKGFIELNVNSIVKYGVCRLIIEISDSGEGMGLEKINTILNTTEELTQKDMEKIDKLNINLPLAHKIIKTINGNFIIKSELNQGTNFLIIIDQKIEEKKLTEQEKKLENYTKKIITNNKVMLVSVNNKTLENISKELNQSSITTINALYGKDCIEKLKEDNSYKAIIIDDKLKNESGIEVLNQIKKINNTTPIIVIIKQNKEFMAHHYIEDGFDEYIIEENIEKDIKKINKYL